MNIEFIKCLDQISIQQRTQQSSCSLYCVNSNIFITIYICTSLRTGRETSDNAHVTSIVEVYPTSWQQYCSTNNGPYLLLVRASYFISCSLHARFASILSMNCKWCWGVGIFEIHIFQCFV